MFVREPITKREYRVWWIHQTIEPKYKGGPRVGTICIIEANAGLGDNEMYVGRTFLNTSAGDTYDRDFGERKSLGFALKCLDRERRKPFWDEYRRNIESLDDMYLDIQE